MPEVTEVTESDNQVPEVTNELLCDTAVPAVTRKLIFCTPEAHVSLRFTTKKT